MSDDTPKKRPRGRPKSSASELPGAPIQALDRGINLLITLAKEDQVSLSDLALSVGMPPSTAHRMLGTLEKHGFVELDAASQHWSIGVEAFRVGNSYLRRTNLVDSARPFMRYLTEQTGETANLAIADQGDVVFVSQVESHNPIRAFFRSGTRGFMHTSGIGKALLATFRRAEVEKILQKKGCPEFTEKSITSPTALFADLAQIKQRGWALDDEERYSGMRCVAAPIYNAFSEAIAGVSVSGPTVRFPDDAIAEIAPMVKKAAQEITESIGGVAPASDPGGAAD
ncbi:Transcriptional repressor IclR [Sinobacterium norvegicum]|uniref:HTH-type transcriptional repressor AllR n=1 Tax=Sinobacterium norvegicum TaxID=1641715 RepID=A0ABM9AD88_9GAMM|nr:HTH-type transcriptional regulator BhcR [Sinobacterium norvegicum]CAH0991160.1 Transcriptional repressor IclR [Sinobacterium norvegicum]